jgi:adenylate kinase
MPDSRSGDPGSKASMGRRVPAGAPEHTLPKIIIVTGTPGVGKTALGKRLAREIGYGFLRLGDLVKTEGLHKGFDRKACSYIIDEHAVERRLKHYFAISREKGIVFETHYVGSIVHDRSGLVAIVLRLDPLVLSRRLKARRWPKRKIWDNVEAEMIDFSLIDSLRSLGKNRVVEFDATGKRPRELVREVLRELSKGRGGHLNSSIDWLEKYDPILLSRKIL